MFSFGLITQRDVQWGEKKGEGERKEKRKKRAGLIIVGRYALNKYIHFFVKTVDLGNIF
jgi:hypothetical protein